jgi:hypothetical protein
MASGIAGDEFRSRLKAVLDEPAAEGLSQREQPNSSTPAAPPAPQPVPAPYVPTAATPEPEPSEEVVAAAQRRAESIRAGKRRAVEAVEDKSPVQEQSGANQQDWKLQQRKREQQQRQERERILRQIQQDKEDRRHREEQRKASAIASEQEPTVSTTSQPSTSSTPQQFRLQVRLFDGTSIRSSFSPAQTIHGDIRPWLDEQRSDGNTPYTLKHILTPLPNRTISDSEEEQTLTDLGLGPTANLVMVPVQSYTEAYASVGPALPVRGLYAGYNLLLGTIDSVAGAVGSFLGIGTATPSNSDSDPQTHPGEPSGPSSGSGNNGRDRTRGPGTSNINVRTLRDQRDERGDHQFYNGNQVRSPMYSTRSPRGQEPFSRIPGH